MNTSSNIKQFYIYTLFGRCIYKNIFLFVDIHTIYVLTFHSMSTISGRFLSVTSLSSIHRHTVGVELPIYDVIYYTNSNVLRRREQMDEYMFV